MSRIDEPGNVRSGEELDPQRLARFLADRFGWTGDLEVRQFPAGHSNLTYLVRAGDREAILRRPPHGTKAATAHDMGREYRILQALRPVFPQVPEPLAYVEDPDVLGSPFYLMERLKGIIVRKELPEGTDGSPETVRAMYEGVIGLQARMHTLNWEETGLSEFGKPAGYARRQVEGWSKRYRAARTPDVPDGEEVMGWLGDHVPPDDPRPGLIHNDYRLDNLVLDAGDPTRILGVLDWEMATIGDPLMDIGCSLAYWVEAEDAEELQLIRMQPSHLPGAPTRMQYVETYCRLTGREVPDFRFYLTFGIFRLAVIAQQIYYRYHLGQTTDKRFAALGFAASVMEKTAWRVIAGDL